MIDRLPPELISLIASSLSQSDCYHLLLTSKSLYHASLSRLYDAIIVDSTNYIYHEELLDFNDVIEYGNNKYKSTVVKTCNGLKHFFKTLQNNESLIHLINYLKVVKVPDHFIEFELVTHFKFLFQKLDNLKGLDFQYNSCFINLNSLIGQLAQHQKLTELTGDFTTTISMKKKKLHGLMSLAESHYPLEKLSLINFQSSVFLRDLQLPTTLTKLSVCRYQTNTFPTNYSLVNTIGIDFNYLQDCFNKYFYNGMTNELQNDFNSIFLRNRTTSTRTNSDTDFDSIAYLFQNNKHRLNIQDLRFEGVTFKDGDDKVLARHCNLNKLTKLTLLECDETHNSYWLHNISPHLANLKELNINYENHFDIPYLLTHIKSLDKLYVNVQDPEMMWDALAFFKSLNKHKQLTRLIIDTSSENQLKAISIKMLEKKLIKFTQLVKLRITISIRSLSRFIYNVLPFLQKLEFLELIFEEFNVVNSSGSNSAYMVDDLIYDNDNDNEFEFNMNELSPHLLTLNKAKLINEQILNMSPSLRYTKIFNVLLTKDNFIKERGLESWFSENLL